MLHHPARQLRPARATAHLTLLTTALLGAVPGGCRGEPDAGQGRGPAMDRPLQPDADSQGAMGGNAQTKPNPYGLEPFHADWPRALEYPPDLGRPLYNRGRTAALEQVVERLTGAGMTKEVWRFTKEFFDRNPPDAVREMLVAGMERMMLHPARQDVAQNFIESMGRMDDPWFAPALGRALESPKQGVRNAALQAMGRSGTVNTVQTAFELLPVMDGRGVVLFVENTARLLGDEAAPFFERLIRDPSTPEVMARMIVDQCQQLSPQVAAGIAAVRWEMARLPEEQQIIATLLHRAGDAKGTAWWQEKLVAGNATDRMAAIPALLAGDPGPVLGDLFACSEDENPDVRATLARALGDLDHPNAKNLLETLRFDPNPGVRAAALRAMGEQGQEEAFFELVEEARTATGTRLVALVEVFETVKLEAAARVFIERYRDAHPADRRPWVQSLARVGGPEAMAFLLQEFLGEEQLLGDGVAPPTTLTFLPLQMLNIRGEEQMVLDALDSLDEGRYRHRAQLLWTVAGIAADREDPEIRAAAWQRVRDVVFDPGELPQLRWQALVALEKDLRLEDAMRLKSGLLQEKPGMRALLNAFLHTHF